MESDSITGDVKGYFLDILSTNVEKQKKRIEEIYFEECQLTNPYMVLQGREEIIRSYATLAKNNMDLIVNISSVTYDKDQQLCMADIEQIMRPKALGGVMSVRMHIILKLQLEQDNDGLYRIVNHQEIPVAQDLISQMPILGGWYDSTIRNAVGQISMAGSAVLEYTGFLDFAPKAVDAT
ncbi:hypothetical protein HDU91_001400, partial [Kappamyces sp. JEL0680]